MSSNTNGKPFSKLGPKAQLQAVKMAQAVNEPQPIVEIKVVLLNNNQVVVTRPEGETVQNFAAIIDLLATAQKIIAHKLAQCQGEPSRIVVPPPGMKVQ